MADAILIGGYLLIALTWGFVVLIISKVERWYDSDYLAEIGNAVLWPFSMAFFAVRTLFRAMEAKADTIAEKYR